MIFRRVLGCRHALLVASLTLPWSSGCRSGVSGNEGPSDGAVPLTGLDGSGAGTSDSASPSGGFDAAVASPEGAPADAAFDDGSAGPDANARTDGGASDDGGGEAGGCQGVAIVPDDTGYVAPTSNSVGIHGSWFVYSDCADLKGKDCSTVTTPTGTGFANVNGKICTSGMTSTATGAWGAGIGLELNDGPPQQPYDTVKHGVTGFCFELSGATLPSTSIRVAFPTQDNNDNAYFEAVSTPGVHTVLFSDTAQGSWVTDKVAFQPSAVMLVQFQIPSSAAAPVPWDFCVEGMTAVTQ
jgi:hypothetical protein